MCELLYSLNGADDSVFEKLKTYESFLRKWNKNLNLVSNKSLPLLWDRHIVDSLQIIPFLGQTNKLADMGTGIGLPSIPLAIVCPGINIFAIEIQQKKVALLSELIRILAIPNIHLFYERAETVVVSHMDVVCCRAFGEFTRDANLAYKMLKPGGLFLTYKSKPEKNTPNGYKQVSHHKYRLPKYSKEFYVVETQKIGEIE